MSIQSIIDKLSSYSSEDIDNVFKMLTYFNARNIYQSVQQFDLVPIDKVKEKLLEKKKLLQSIMITPTKPNISMSHPTYNGYCLIANKSNYSLSYKSERYVYNWLSTKLCYPIKIFLGKGLKKKKV